jgi:HTH-type transcriptional regulator / antitoxin HigA
MTKTSGPMNATALNEAENERCDMVQTAIRFRPGKPRDSYMELIERLPLRKILNDDHLNEALDLIEELMVKAKLNAGESAYFEVLSELVQDYENEHHAIPPASDADLLAFLIDQKETTAYRVAKETSIAKSAISDVLNGKKGFTKSMVSVLSDHFGVDRSVLLQNF